MRWSNDELKSTLHRVRAPVRKEGDGEYTKERYSIPWVCFFFPHYASHEKSCSLRSLEVADHSSAGRMLIESSMRFLEHGTRIGQRNIHPSPLGSM
jgi:isopenicillin N synthase-like dioxygenase